MDKSQLKGLNASQVEASRAKHGSNILSPPKKISPWILFFEKFQDPVIRILLIAALLSLLISFVHHEFAETIGIFCAIFLSVGVGFWFEHDASKKFDLLNQVNDDNRYSVIRDGEIMEIAKKDIVVGDIIILSTGEEIPADGELLEAISLQIDESNLTGEPVIDKTTNSDLFDEEATYPSNWAMRGTNIVDGHGIMEVKQVGDATEYGKVAQKSTEISQEETPLNRQLDGLAKFIGFMGLILATLTFSALFLKDLFLQNVSYSHAELWTLGATILSTIILLAKIWMPIIYDGLSLFKRAKSLPKLVQKSWALWIIFGILSCMILLGVGWILGINPADDSSWISVDEAGQILQYFMIAVTLVVVAVPEGLPMSVTLSLAMSMRRMLKTNNLVRKMHACETMGAITVICTDKTGTLTQNRMRVHDATFYALPEGKLNPEELISRLVIENIAVNSTANLEFHPGEEPKPIGNPTEASLLLWLYDCGINYKDIRLKMEVLHQLTFSTERKYMATVIYSENLKKRILFVKGAPEIVFSLSREVGITNGQKASTAEYKARVESKLLEYQNKAMRTLGLAYQIRDENDTNPPFANGKLENVDLTFIGVFAISDPIREEVPAAVQKCLNAGISVKMVTGDTPGTAREIGRQIGIWDDQLSAKQIITGPQFEALSDEEAENICQELRIMCRARPTDKQRLVQLLQKRKEIVAVTGDGTNDAPALNHANVGLSMGSGTSVAKGASDITLLDDSFNSIATAVMWGRSLYQNIQRFVLFQLTINVAALAIVFLGSVFGHELPLTVTQMLWVNLIMDTFAAGALASLPPNANVMNDKPRNAGAFISTRLMTTLIISMGIAFVVFLLWLLAYWRESNDEITPYHLSEFFTIFVMLQFWNLFNAKAFESKRSALAGLWTSKAFLLVAGLILAGQYLIVTFGGEVFRTVPLAWEDWLTIIAGTSIVLWVGELARWIYRKRN
ncbi:MAG: calcium-translocating P-type ATPase, PMCA-type [Dysgonamonadaceae bacterium]